MVGMRPSAQTSTPSEPSCVVTGASRSPGANHKESKCHKNSLSARPASEPSVSITKAALYKDAPSCAAAPTTIAVRSDAAMFCKRARPASIGVRSTGASPSTYAGSVPSGSTMRSACAAARRTPSTIPSIAPAKPARSWAASCSAATRTGRFIARSRSRPKTAAPYRALRAGRGPAAGKEILPNGLDRVNGALKEISNRETYAIDVVARVCNRERRLVNSCAASAGARGSSNGRRKRLAERKAESLSVEEQRSVRCCKEQVGAPEMPAVQCLGAGRRVLRTHEVELSRHRQYL